MIIPIYDMMLLPGMHTQMTVKHMDTDRLKKLMDKGEQLIALPLKHQVDHKPESDDYYRIGVVLRPESIQASTHGTKMQVQITSFAKVSNLHRGEHGMGGDVMVFYDDVDLDHPATKEMLDYIKGIAEEGASHFQGGDQIMDVINDFDDLNAMMGYMIQGMNVKASEKYSLMETQSLKKRTLMFIDILKRFNETLKLQVEMSEHFTERANKNYREQALREQMRLIQEELNDGKEDTGKKKDYRTRVEEADLPEEVEAAVLDELDKLESQNPQSSDYNVIRNYVDFILDLPWHAAEADDLSIDEARRVLNDHHYGLDKVKDRIIQHLAVMQLKKDKKGSIVLLVGPPGTGKTSLGRSIATAMNREYVRISLGGVRDEAQIRGHRRTYVGALPGRILKGMKDAGTTNPVMVLDEIDKLMAGYSGDPASALLEVLDPEQNNTFTDNYLDLPYDLSNVMFITTANSIDTIPRPLLDRMEVIQISSYTSTEKYHIAKDHLVRKSLEEHGLKESQMTLDDATLQRIIDEFTMEAGVRGLKKQLDKLARVTAEKVVSGNVEDTFHIHPDDLDELLGRKVSRHEKAQEINPPGVVTGLAWTPVGGEILFIEATDLPGKGGITLTGKLGDVMQESAKIALSLLKSRLPVNAVSFKEKDIHIHVPSGAVPKDGPSAGIALFTSLASLVTGIPVNGHIAMTGEVSLRGAVMPIGGLKEKLIAAQRAGITKALIPVDNEADLKDVPQEVLNQLEVIPVTTVEDVLRETLNLNLPRPQTVSWLNQDDKGGFFLKNS